MKSAMRVYFPWIIAVITLACAVFFYGKYQKAVGSINEIQRLTAALGKVMLLPTGEDPTLATVTDIAKLPKIPFFTHAAIGDKVLVYQGAAKAILYRPSTKKIIETSVFTAPKDVSLTTTPTAQEQLTLELRNGTAKSGLTADFEKVIERLAPDVRVIDRSASKRKDYKDSMIIYRTSSRSKKATELAKSLDISVGVLPEGEASISSDFVIILGTDVIDAK